MQTNNLSLGQRSYLLQCAIDQNELTEEYKDELWRVTGFITERKYNFLLALYYSKQKELFKKELDNTIKFER